MNAEVVATNQIPLIGFNTTKINDAIDAAKEEFIKTINDKSKWAALFLFMISFFLIWVIIYYIYSKLSLESYNNNRMNAFYSSLGGTKIGVISGCNVDGKNCESGIHTNLIGGEHPKLRDFYIMSSYNSCCGGNSKKDWVSLKPLEQVIQQGVRFLDFEIYSRNGTPIVAAGGPVNSNGRHCLKGTYNQLNFEEVMEKINVTAYNLPANKEDPLFLNFRIKTNNKTIYNKMHKTIMPVFGTESSKDRSATEDFRFDGSKTNDNSISNIPLYKLKGKVIISINDVNHNYIGSKFEELISMSDKSTQGIGMPYVHSYKNLEIKDAYDPESLIEENKKYLGISYPDFTNTTSNSSAALHHTFGIQFVTMNFHIIDQHLKYYLTVFNDAGSAFVLKPSKLRYKPVKIDEPANQSKQLSFAPKESSILGGAGKISLG